MTTVHLNHVFKKTSVVKENKVLKIMKSVVQNNLMNEWITSSPLIGSPASYARQMAYYSQVQTWRISN
jgi:hypothetical protein